MHEIFPLITFRDPRELWETQPTYLVAEMGLILLTLFLGKSIVANGRTFFFYALACFFGGALIELYTILEPNIGNFYHSMTAIMTFGDREPAYMLCCYIFIQFMALVLAKNPQLSILGEACLAALLGTFLIGLLDVVGLKFLWWTWHNGDPLYADRNAGVPIASGIWFLCSTWCLSMTLRVIAEAKWFKSVPLLLLPVLAAIAGPFATLGLMNIPMSLSFHVLVTYLKYHASVALLVLRLFSFLTVLWSLFTHPRGLRFAPRYDLFLQTLAYLALFASIPLLGTPEAVRRHSFSQPFGRDCTATEPSFWGAFQRTRYVCPEGTDPQRDHYSFDCISSADLPADGTTQYTVCGVPIQGDWWFQLYYLLAGSFFLTLLAQLAPATTSKTAVSAAATGSKKKPLKAE